MQNTNQNWFWFHLLFLLSLVVVGIAIAGLILHITGSIWMMLIYLAGFITPLVFARITPSFESVESSIKRTREIREETRE